MASSNAETDYNLRKEIDDYLAILDVITVVLMSPKHKKEKQDYQRAMSEQE